MALAGTCPLSLFSTPRSFWSSDCSPQSSSNGFIARHALVRSTYKEAMQWHPRLASHNQDGRSTKGLHAASAAHSISNLSDLGALWERHFPVSNGFVFEGRKTLHRNKHRTPLRHSKWRRGAASPHAAAVSERPAPTTPRKAEPTPKVAPDTFERRSFPLSSIVGNEAAKKALLIAAIDPKLGGIAIAGPRGTAKTVMARAFPALLPQIEVVMGSWANVDPGREDEWESGLRAKVERGGKKVETEWRNVPFVQVRKCMFLD